MRNVAVVAQALRDVRLAGEEFALRSMIDQTIIGPLLLDRLADDLDNIRENYTPPFLQRLVRLDDES